LQPLQGVDLVRPGRQHEQIGRAEYPNAPGGLESVHSGHAHVERCNKRIEGSHEFDAFESRAGGVHPKTGLLENISEQRSDVGIVFDHDGNFAMRHLPTPWLVAWVTGSWSLGDDIAEDPRESITGHDDVADAVDSGAQCGCFLPALDDLEVDRRHLPVIASSAYSRELVARPALVRRGLRT
jgi:hypothetical protein